ncbi:hypothetical protein EVAR_64341_1 [Eumeta japonica]|uniref:Uncharacterized protein n=1 Tax=Eumeta variegata TaxID=151549 RepID=A0A4C1ZNL8_EUMVA|nr:hypothetical protein EVAR_64341_1 [Eumeta japonica]
MHFKLLMLGQRRSVDADDRRPYCDSSVPTASVPSEDPTMRRHPQNDNPRQFKGFTGSFSHRVPFFFRGGRGTSPSRRPSAADGGFVAVRARYPGAVTRPRPADNARLHATPIVPM